MRLERNEIKYYGGVLERFFFILGAGEQGIGLTLKEVEYKVK